MEAGASDVQPAKDDDGNLEGYKVRDPKGRVAVHWGVGDGARCRQGLPPGSAVGLGGAAEAAEQALAGGPLESPGAGERACWGTLWCLVRRTMEATCAASTCTARRMLTECWRCCRNPAFHTASTCPAGADECGGVWRSEL